MPDIAYVCLSDLHFGADNSLLTNVRGGEVQTDDPSDVLVALVACLRKLASANLDRRPRLVLAGDVLDLALSMDADAIKAFDHFVQLAFADGEPIFDDTVYFVPGNHDHHLWETAREELYTDYLRPTDRPVTNPWHVTRMFDAGAERGSEVGSRHGAPSPLLQTIIERHAGVDTRIWTVYPNLGFSDPALGRTVVIHHGHFVEPTYRLMSKLRDMMFADRPRQAKMTIADLEAENFAWIDFLWSTLGRSGGAGQDVKLIYQLLQDEDALSNRVGVLSRSIAELWPGRRWGRPPERVFGAVLGKLLTMPVRRVGRPARFAKPVPEAGGLPITAKVLDGVPLYLESFAVPQMGHELDRPPGDITFVFGHTHKPFERSWPIDGTPVSVFNTGGWVVDTPKGDTRQGASIVVVDDQLQVASIRCYNQPEGDGQQVGTVPPVSVCSLPAGEEFRGKLAAFIEADQPPWSEFTAALAPAIRDRHALLAAVVESYE